VRKIYAGKITKAVAQLCIQANTELRPDVYKALESALSRESKGRAREILKILLENADCAHDLKLAICQDTGLAQVFVELGQQAQICGGDFTDAVNKGIEKGYKEGCLRNSVIMHPLKRKAAPRFSPGVVHIDMVGGSHIKLTVLPKGFGCENKAAVRMFNPTAGMDAVKDFIIQQVKKAGGDACPPYIIGVGIGGGMDKAALLAKKALLRPLDKKNPDKLLAKLEKELSGKLNRLRIGPMGLGGKITALGVNILTYPTHIAGLPVAVNISCHALRSASKTL
jgi:fumarate hydratase subunit alpha